MANQTLPTPAALLVKPDGRPDDIWYQRLSLMWDAFNSLRTESTAAADSLSDDIDDGVDARVATQAEIEAAASVTQLVTPGRTQYHPGVAKAWGFVTVSGGAPALTAGHNIASVTDGGPGVHSPQFTTAMSSVNYAVVATIVNTSPGSARILEAIVTAHLTTGFTVSILHEDALAGGNADLLDDISFNFVVFGDQ